MSSAIGAFANVAHKFVTWPHGSTQEFCKVRGVDEDVYSMEVLYCKSGSKDVKAGYDSSRIAISGHWRLQQDLETIRAAANPE